MYRSYHKNAKNTKGYDSISSKSASPVEMVSIENYLYDYQCTKFKTAIISIIKAHSRG